MTEDEFRVVDAMYKYGGSFVRALSECFYRADVFNVIKLKEAFPEYWKQYDEMSQKDEQESI
jgi:hypothetical protein